MAILKYLKTYLRIKQEGWIGDFINMKNGLINCKAIEEQINSYSFYELIEQSGNKFSK